MRDEENNTDLDGIDNSMDTDLDLPNIDDMDDETTLDNSMDDQEIEGLSSGDELDEEEEFEPFEPKNKPNYKLYGIGALGVVLIGAAAFQVFGSKSVPASPAPGFGQPSITAQQAAPAKTTANPVSMAEQRKLTGFESKKPQRDIAGTDPYAPPTLGGNAPPKVTNATANSSSIVLDEKGINTLSDKMAESIAAKLTQAMIDAHGEAGPGTGAASMSPVINRVDDLHVKVDKILDTLNNEAGSTGLTDRHFDEIASRLSKMGNFANSEPYIVEGKYEGRTRMTGFKVFKTSGDGTMAVVRTPSNRVNVYFVGERFYAHGQHNKVTGVEKDGWVVLVGDKHFIDAKREPVPYTAKPAKKPAAKKAVAKAPVAKSPAAPAAEPASRATTTVIKSEKMASSQPIKGDHNEGQSVWWTSGDVEVSKVNDCCTKPRPVASYNEANASGQQLSGWTLHAINNGQYLLRDNNAKWHSAYLGKNFKTYGKVEGVNANNELIIGTNAVKMVGH